jgi:hypothetical protein
LPNMRSHARVLRLLSLNEVKHEIVTTDELASG